MKLFLSDLPHRISVQHQNCPQNLIILEQCYSFITHVFKQSFYSGGGNLEFQLSITGRKVIKHHREKGQEGKDVSSVLFAVNALFVSEGLHA